VYSFYLIKSDVIVFDESDHAKEQEIQPHYESNIDDDAYMEQYIKQFTVSWFIFVHEIIS